MWQHPDLTYQVVSQSHQARVQAADRRRQTQLVRGSSRRGGARTLLAAFRRSQRAVSDSNPVVTHLNSPAGRQGLPG